MWGEILGKLKHPKKVYVMRRVLVSAILVMILSLLAIFSIKFFGEANTLRKKHAAELEDYRLEDMRLNLNVIEKSYQWDKALDYNNNPKKIILHHSASKETNVESIDSHHRDNGWSGIGYHYFINKEGEIYQGRPEGAIGAHAYKNNTDTIGICLEGNFEEELVTEKEYNSLIELMSYIAIKYPIKDVIEHKAVFSTACPGKNFKIDNVKKDLIKSIEKNKISD